MGTDVVSELQRSNKGLGFRTNRRETRFAKNARGLRTVIGYGERFISISLLIIYFNRFTVLTQVEL